MFGLFGRKESSAFDKIMETNDPEQISQALRELPYDSEEPSHHLKKFEKKDDENSIKIRGLLQSKVHLNKGISLLSHPKKDLTPAAGCFAQARLADLHFFATCVADLLATDNTTLSPENRITFCHLSPVKVLAKHDKQINDLVLSIIPKKVEGPRRWTRIKPSFQQEPQLPGPSTPLHEAAATGNLKEVKSLLKADPQAVHARNLEAHTPLHLAALGGHNAVVLHLRVCGADPNARDEKLQTPLFLATKAGEARTQLCLLEREASPNFGDVNLETPLFAAIDIDDEKLSMEMTQALIKFAAQVDLKAFQLTLKYPAGRCRSLFRLLLAGTSYQADDSFFNQIKDEVALEELHNLIQYKMDFNHAVLALDTPQPDPSKINAQFENIQNKDPGLFRECLFCLLKVQHDKLSRIQLQNLLALRIIERRYFLDGQVDEMIESVKKTYESTPLIYAAGSGDLEYARQWLNQDKSYRSKFIERDKDNNNPLHHAACRGNLEMAKLLKGSDDPNLINAYGVTPLAYAVKSGNNPDLVSWLLDEGGAIESLHITDRNGNTPLHLAFRCAGPEMMQILLENGSPIHLPNKSGYTALDVACLNPILLQLFLTFLSHTDLSPEELLRDTTKILSDTARLLLECKILINNGIRLFQEENREGALRYFNEAQRLHSGLFNSWFIYFSGHHPENFNFSRLSDLLILSQSIEHAKHNPQLKPLSESERPFPESSQLALVEEFHTMVNAGNIDKVSEFLEINSRVIDLPNSNGETALYIAVLKANTSHNLEMVTLLLDQLADPNIATNSALTPLHVADTTGQRLLLEYGAHFHQPDSTGATPLHRAIFRNGETAHLLQKGARVDLPNKAGQTVLETAVICHSEPATLRALLVRMPYKDDDSALLNYFKNQIIIVEAKGGVLQKTLDRDQEEVNRNETNLELLLRLKNQIEDQNVAALFRYKIIFNELILILENSHPDSSRVEKLSSDIRQDLEFFRECLFDLLRFQLHTLTAIQLQNLLKVPLVLEVASQADTPIGELIIKITQWIVEPTAEAVRHEHYIERLDIESLGIEMLDPTPPEVIVPPQIRETRSPYQDSFIYSHALASQDPGRLFRHFREQLTPLIGDSSSSQQATGASSQQTTRTSSQQTEEDFSSSQRTMRASEKTGRHIRFVGDPEPEIRSEPVILSTGPATASADSTRSPSPRPGGTS